MHPLLVAGYVINLVVVSGIFGFFWALVVLGISGLMYFKLGSKDAAKKEHIAHVLAFGFVYGVACFAVYKASPDPTLAAVTILVEIFAFGYLNFLGSRNF